MRQLSYVLVTAARNEEAYIEGTILSVVEQTLKPLKWVIVSDSSSDKTDAIVLHYTERYDFIELVRKETTGRQKGFASKVAAIHLGYERLKALDYEFIGNLDADISFKADYFEVLLKKFFNNPRLGIGGGYIYVAIDGEFRPRPSNDKRSVAGGIQMFRRECYETIGGLQPFALGGEDWCAEIMARMAGWQVQAFPDLEVLHHKQGSTVRGFLRDNFRQGLLDHSFGSLVAFEFIKCIRRVREQPYCICAMLRFAGYVWGYCSGKRRVLSDVQTDFLRDEQVRRILGVFKVSELSRDIKIKQ